MRLALNIRGGEVEFLFGDKRVYPQTIRPIFGSAYRY